MLVLIVPCSSAMHRDLKMTSLFLTSALGLAMTLGCACKHPQAPAGAVPATTATLAPPRVPAAIAVPAGAQLVAHLHATGAQVYGCGPGPAGGAAFAWTLKKPDATLTDDSGAVVGTHVAGPTWTSTDGSAVVGKKLAQADAPDATAVPWLLLRAVSSSGTGVFSGVTYVQRVATTKGEPPATGCEAATVGAEARADYTADYYFYRGGAT